MSLQKTGSYVGHPSKESLDLPPSIIVLFSETASSSCEAEDGDSD